MNKTNIILIGMPSSGKSTIGRILADQLGTGFMDTDTLIENYKNKTPREIVEQEGLNEFLKTQDDVIMSLDVSNQVIATGGSVIYGQGAMEHLKKIGHIVYLRLELEEVEKRLAAGRRFARREGQSMRELFDERTPLYEMYSDIVVDCKNKSPEDIVSDIKAVLREAK